MQSAALVNLLQAALSLLALVQTSPNIPQSLQTTAIQTAQQAIALATSEFLAGTFESQTATTSSNLLPPPNSPPSVLPSPENNSLSASPTSGTAPLTVTFSGNVPALLNNGAYWIDFGDGSRIQQGICTRDILSANVTCSFGLAGISTVTHIYKKAGTYVARLASIPGSPVSEQVFNAATPVGSAVIVVSSSDLNVY